jgi:trehalose 6-phosphate phosphatase
VKNIFEKDGCQALDAFCMANTLFAFDYDGTLAPIVEDPAKAHMRPETGQLLSELTQFAPVALISGRAKCDVINFIPQTVDYIVGNHGLEGLPGGSPSLEEAKASSQKWVKSLDQNLNLPGIMIENKTYSISIHYRKCPNRRKAKSNILNLAVTLEPLPRVIMGKCVVNLISPGAPHKGVALLEIMLHSGCGSAVYFGDDDNDEDVFSLNEESLLTVRIGKKNSSAAMFYLNSQTDIDKTLVHCLTSLKKIGRPNRSMKPFGVAHDLKST